jgi:redox-regulated HSP33 family molecular chaperone
MSRLFLSLLLACCLGAAVPASADEAPKNLKVLPKTMSRADVKKLMKIQAKSLGVECEFCHDTDDFAKDGEKKEAARAMMKMTDEINKNYFKNDKNEIKVGCVTCHNGQKTPKKPG